MGPATIWPSPELPSRRRKIRLYPQHDLARTERFCDVIVRSKLQPNDSIDLLGFGGEHQDRDFARLRIRT